MKIGFITWFCLFGIFVSLFSYWKVAHTETLFGFWVCLVIFCVSLFVDCFYRKREE